MQVRAASHPAADRTCCTTHTLHGFTHATSVLYMASNTVAAAPPPPASLETGGAGLTVATAGAFEPCAWGDFFVTYAPPVSQEAEERMRERAHQLKGEVRRRMFEAAGGEALSVADMVTLVNTLQCLGIDNHFRHEVDAALKLIQSLGTTTSKDDDGLHTVALRFRLLRQHGVWVPADVFDRFRDDTGGFSASLSSDPRGLLSLQRGSHGTAPGEQALDEAIAFSRRHLESAMKGKRLSSPLEEQVSRALDIPLVRLPKRLETMHYIHEYAKELRGAQRRGLELARLDFDLFKLSSKYYLDEAKWSSEKYAPSFKEHMKVSVMSSGFPTLAVVLLMGAGDMATREAFQWAIGVPDVVNASGEVARFLNDIASYKNGKNKKDVASSVECYAKENGTSGEEAVTAIAEMAEHAWRTINRSCMEMDCALLPAAQLVVNLTKTLEVIYLGGRDAYTFAADLKDLVVSLFLNGPTV